jgi:hypothetical protein
MMKLIKEDELVVLSPEAWAAIVAVQEILAGPAELRPGQASNLSKVLWVNLHDAGVFKHDELVTK